MDMGESLVASYLRYFRRCSVVSKNMHLEGQQGEVDVVGIVDAVTAGGKRTVYLCESSVHLGGGGFHGKEVERVKAKAQRALILANDLFPDDTYDRVFEFWTSHFAVRKAELTEQALQDLVGPGMFTSASMIANAHFAANVRELERMAAENVKPTSEPAFRMLQILQHIAPAHE